MRWKPISWLNQAVNWPQSWSRTRFTSGGLAFTLGTLAVGFAALNTGNNLLYLLLGAMLGFIAVSALLSGHSIQKLQIERSFPRGVTVGHEFCMTYKVTNRKRYLSSMALEISEAGLPGRAFVANVQPNEFAFARSLNTFVKRGIYPLGTTTLSSSFPFGMFRKVRDVVIPGEIIVWPRTNRVVRDSALGDGQLSSSDGPTQGALGIRGEYRNLRGYRPGDDPNDIHWRSSARLGEPVIREYERDGGETRWICLDTTSEAGDASELALEVTASLASQALGAQQPFALVAGSSLLQPGEGAGHLERALEILARIDFGPAEPVPQPPVRRERCLLVSVHPRSGFGNTFTVGPDGPPNPSGYAA